MLKQLSAGINTLIFSLILVFIEVVARYLLDTIDVGYSRSFAIWDLFGPDIVMIFYVTVIQLFNKGWIYLVLLLIFEGIVYPKIMKDKYLKVVILGLFFLPLTIWDHLSIGSFQGVLYDAIASYLAVGFSYYLIRFHLIRPRLEKGNNASADQ